MHYGIWHESWQACLRAHNIEWTPKEEERCTEAAKISYYQTHDSTRKHLNDLCHELGRRAHMHPNEVDELIREINPR